MMEMAPFGADCLTVAGAAQAAVGLVRPRLLLPVELRRVNHGASTNGADSNLKGIANRGNLQSDSMSAASPIDQIAERVERLLVRHEELQRTNALLQEQVDALARERDALKSRLAAARTRIDALLDRLPVEPKPSEDSAA